MDMKAIESFLYEVWYHSPDREEKLNEIRSLNNGRFAEWYRRFKDEEQTRQREAGERFQALVDSFPRA